MASGGCPMSRPGPDHSDLLWCMSIFIPRSITVWLVSCLEGQSGCRIHYQATLIWPLMPLTHKTNIEGPVSTFIKTWPLTHLTKPFTTICQMKLIKSCPKDHWLWPIKLCQWDRTASTKPLTHLPFVIAVWRVYWFMSLLINEVRFFATSVSVVELYLMESHMLMWDVFTFELMYSQIYLLHSSLSLDYLS